MANLSFQEKSAWGTLIALLVLGALYFSSVLNLWRAEQLELPAVFGLGVGFTIMLVVVLIVYHIVLVVLGRPEDDDERDRLVKWRAGHLSGIVLGLCIMAVILQTVIGGMLGRGFGHELASSPALISIALIGAIWLSNVVELGLTIQFYRRGP